MDDLQKRADELEVQSDLAFRTGNVTEALALIRQANDLRKQASKERE